MSLRSRLENLERISRLAMQKQEVTRQAKRAVYESNWREHHRQLAEVLGADTPEEVDLEALGMRPVAAPDPEEVALARKIEHQREIGEQERAASTSQSRTAAWEQKRREILSSRARYKRECEESGQAVVFAAADPPILVPDWFMSKPDGVTYQHHRRVPVNHDGTRHLELADYDAVAGKRIGPPPGLTPEAQFALEAEKQRKEK